MSPDRLKEIRTDMGLTQEAFALLLGFNSGRYIRALESGQQCITPRTEKLIELLYAEEIV